MGTVRPTLALGISQRVGLSELLTEAAFARKLPGIIRKMREKVRPR
jgi:hypothetical protein